MDSSRADDEFAAQQLQAAPNYIRGGTPLKICMPTLYKSPSDHPPHPRCMIQRRQLAYDMSGKWAKMTTELFLAAMPVRCERTMRRHPKWTNMFSKIPKTVVPEVELYPVMRIWIELKKDGNDDDPWSDDKDSAFEVDAENKAKIRGQLIAYAEMAMNQQQCTHLYSVLVMHHFVRLIRWDRSGAVVSEKFDLKKHPETLGMFFWQFAHATDEGQGYDPSAELLGPRTKFYRLMDKMAETELDYPFDYIQELFDKSLTDNWPWYNLTVEDEEKGTHYYLVGKPLSVAPGPVGRGTRSYIAWNVEEAKFVHLKASGAPTRGANQDQDEEHDQEHDKDHNEDEDQDEEKRSDKEPNEAQEERADANGRWAPIGNAQASLGGGNLGLPESLQGPKRSHPSLPRRCGYTTSAKVSNYWLTCQVAATTARELPGRRALA
ncbi:hypothetical protein A0H81_01955 [Grifola frondosa]|uniref:Fungal-type protein kinase domain-containing protein n=1 Tax=Grifola frondosa TaxID=5627 RepID=A0A1C7MKR5_GRIFR|nr:hypothetical protein A0H81_01955 [Grifola frondosa]